MTETIYDLLWITKSIMAIILMFFAMMCSCKYLRKGGQ